MRTTAFSVVILSLVVLGPAGRAADARAPRTEGYANSIPHPSAPGSNSKFGTGAAPAWDGMRPLSPELDYPMTFTYQIDVEIRYDVVADGVTYPDTPVWGMPAGVGLSSGKLVLGIDGAGNASGSSTLHPVYGLGMLYGKRLYELYNATVQLNGGSWGTPIGNVAPLTGGIVDLGDSLIGDFSGLNTITGFIKDGNSGDFFDLRNGLGLDGKIEFTATGPDGMSLTFKAKTYGGAGTGWYLIGVDGGDISYSNGTDTARTGITGVVSYNMWIDAGAHTFSMPEQILLEGFPADWWQLGRRIDDFSGAVDPTGNFVGTVHFAGIDFTSLTGSTANGTFTDGNSASFDTTNGLAPGDTLNAVFVDSTGLFDLVITGELLPDLDGDGYVTLTDVQMVAGAWHTANLDYDFDGDDKVTVVDIAIVVALLGQ